MSSSWLEHIGHTQEADPKRGSKISMVLVIAEQFILRDDGDLPSLFV